jgi:hypothetical protein
MVLLVAQLRLMDCDEPAFHVPLLGFAVGLATFLTSAALTIYVSVVTSLVL